MAEVSVSGDIKPTGAALRQTLTDIAYRLTKPRAEPATPAGTGVGGGESCGH